MPRAKKPIHAPRGRPVKRADSERIVEAILAAAIELGPDASIAAIAERAGVGRASLHRYFPTTMAIFAEVSRQMYRTLLEQVRVVTRRPDLDVRRVVEEVVAIALEGPKVSLAYRRRLNLEIPLDWSRETAEAIYAEVLGELAAYVRRNDPAPPVDLEQRIFVAFASVRGVVLVSLLFPDLAPPIESISPQVVDLVMHALTAPPPVSAPRTSTAEPRRPR